MLEKSLYSILLALHNIALVACVAGPFYMARIVKARAPYGNRVIYEMDRLEEDVVTTQPVICFVAIVVLYVTGIGFPVVYFLFHGELRETSAVAAAGFWVKQALVLGMVAIQFYGAFVLNPRLKELFARFGPGQTPDPHDEAEFFRVRALRKKWCDRCLWLGILVLVVTPLIRWF